MRPRYYLLTAVVGLATFSLLEEILNAWIAGILALWISCAPALWGLLRSENEPVADQESLSEPGESVRGGIGSWKRVRTGNARPAAVRMPPAARGSTIYAFSPAT
jgi:hypothetical protein